MKKKNNQKDTKKLRIILDILIILIGFVFLYFGIRDARIYYANMKKTDAEIFHKEYSYVSVKDCVYEYISFQFPDTYLLSTTNLLSSRQDR